MSFDFDNKSYCLVGGRIVIEEKLIIIEKNMI